MSIAIGTLCYITGLTDKGCKAPMTPANNGRVVITVTPLTRLRQAKGRLAYGVDAYWLQVLTGKRTCYVIPACLIPIVPPTRTPAEQRKREPQPA